MDDAAVPVAESLQQLEQGDDSPAPDVLPHLKPLCTAINMVFGSAAALSAAFGFKVPFYSRVVFLKATHAPSPRHESVLV